MGLNGQGEKVPLGQQTSPQRLKPDLFSIVYVRANARCGEVARTLQRPEFVRSLLGRQGDVYE
jgi:hypothetical protein